MYSVWCDTKQLWSTSYNSQQVCDLDNNVVSLFLLFNKYLKLGDIQLVREERVIEQDKYLTRLRLTRLINYNAHDIIKVQKQNQTKIMYNDNVLFIKKFKSTNILLLLQFYDKKHYKAEK